jgi:hypothetical protein
MPPLFFGAQLIVTRNPKNDHRSPVKATMPPDVLGLLS